MAIIYGAGKFDLTTTGLSPNILVPVHPIEFEINGTSSKKESKKYVDGEIVRAGSRITERLYTCKFGIEAIDWFTIQFAFAELAQTISSVDLPKLKTGVVDSSNKIVDAEITTGNAATVIASLGGRGTWGEQKPLIKSVDNTPAAGEFYPDGSAGEILFHSSYQGAPIAYRILKTYTSIQAINAGTVGQAISSFSFSGIAYGDEFPDDGVQIIIPKLDRVSEPSLSVTDVTKFEVEFDLSTATGKRKTFEIYLLPAGSI